MIAAQGWINLTERESVKGGSPSFVLLSGIAISILVLLPWRAYQAHALVSPYATAMEAIEKSKSDVVVVDFLDIWFGPDLVRNDPFLRKSPKVLSLYNLEESQLRELCGGHDVAIFNRLDARRSSCRTSA